LSSILQNIPLVLSTHYPVRGRWLIQPDPFFHLVPPPATLFYSVSATSHLTPRPFLIPLSPVRCVPFLLRLSPFHSSSQRDNPSGTPLFLFFHKSPEDPPPPLPSISSLYFTFCFEIYNAVLSDLTFFSHLSPMISLVFLVFL